MNLTKILYRFLIFLIIPLIGYGQSNDPTKLTPIVPLSPNAAEFAKYGNIPVSPSTGTPNITIPIYEINTGKIKVPISLSYHASGIQVSQKATWVGLGWSLNAGGIISRSVRGLADEKLDGWMNKQNTTQTIYDSRNPDELDLYAANTYDSHPDFFSYSTPYLSGRFIYSQSKSAFQTIPLEPVKVNRITASGGASIDNTYQITDSEGNNYYYQDKQTYFNDSDLPIEKYIQSWYLSKIVSADTKDTVQFNYTTVGTAGGSNEEISESETHVYSTDDGVVDQNAPANTQYLDKGFETKQSFFYHSYIALKEIIFRTGKVVFDGTTPRKDYAGYMLDRITVYNKSGSIYYAIHQYNLEHDYFTTSQPKTDQLDYRLRLLSLNKTAVNSNAPIEKHQFIYNSLPLPSINSRSMDYWGFYNGAPYNSFLPNILPMAPELSKFAQAGQLVGGSNRNESDAYIQAGMLQKIIYPTGGSTVFNFESHQYVSDQQSIQTVAVADVTLVGIGKKHPTSSVTNFSWPSSTVSNTGPITVSFSAHNNPGAYDVPQRITLKDITTGNNLGEWEHSGDFTKPYTLNTSANFDPTHSYSVTMVVDDDAPTNVKFSLSAQKSQTTTQTKNGGGLRINTIVNYDNNNNLVSTEKYNYSGVSIGKNDNLIANNYIKRTLYKSYALIGPDGSGAGCLQKVYNSITYYGTPQYGGQNFEGANVIYSNVTKTNYDGNNKPNGKIEYNYNTLRGLTSIDNPTIPGGVEYIDNALGRTSFPTSESVYKSNSDGSYSLLKLKEYSYGTPVFFQEGARQVSRLYYWISDMRCLAKSVNDFRLNAYDISIGANKLIGISEKDYNQNGTISATTQYSYDNPVHLQVTKVTSTGSDGKTIIVQNKYPADYTDNTYGSNLLRSQAVNSTVLERIVSKNDILVDKTTVSYRNDQGSILPDYLMKGLTNGTLETRIKYPRYDQYGNVLEEQQTSGPPTAYLWSYNSQYPVVEIRNASYATVESVLGASTISAFATQSPTKAQVDDFVSRLKSSSLLKNSLIKSYSYSPLVGMTSMTDEKGMTTSYEYDSFQRLMNVKDKDGNIVKHMDYHYQGQ